MPKVLKSYSLDFDLCEQLRKYADGRSMSGLVEEGIRLRLKLPLPEPTQEVEEVSHSRVQKEVLKVFNPTGWTSSLVLADRLGESHNVTEKALKGLARNGQAHLWGSGYAEEVDGLRARETRWGLRDPVKVIQAGANRYAAGAKSKETRGTLISASREMLFGADMEIRRKCVEILSHAVGWDVGQLNFFELTPADESVAALDARTAYYSSPEYLAEKAASEKRFNDDVAERIRLAREHEARERRIDLERRLAADP